MAEISMLVTSIDPLAAYKVSDDLILELMSVTASVEDDSEGASVGSGGNLKGSASDGNGWDDRTDLGTGLFRGRHFDQEIIILCIRWYLTYKLSSRDLVQMMAERGITLAHTTILRWVQRYVPDFEKRWIQDARAVGDSWRVDET